MITARAVPFRGVAYIRPLRLMLELPSTLLKTKKLCGKDQTTIWTKRYTSYSTVVVNIVMNNSHANVRLSTLKHHASEGVLCFLAFEPARAISMYPYPALPLEHFRPGPQHEDFGHIPAMEQSHHVLPSSTHVDYLSLNDSKFS